MVNVLQSQLILVKDIGVLRTRLVEGEAIGHQDKEK